MIHIQSNTIVRQLLGSQTIFPMTSVRTNSITGERPNLQALLSFPGKSGNKINIPRQIGTKYFQFGVQLLNDKTGEEIDTIVSKCREDSEQIIIGILKLWVRGKGKPLRWDILIDVLRDIELGTLASDIEEGLHC